MTFLRKNRFEDKSMSNCHRNKKNVLSVLVRQKWYYFYLFLAFKQKLSKEHNEKDTICRDPTIGHEYDSNG